jgi:two-component system sensor histidine kinase RegB
MATDADIGLGSTSRRIKLDTLIGLRWIAIGGQAGAILVVWLWLDFPLPVWLCFALIALSAWLNLFLKLRYPSNTRLRDTPAATLLAYDTVQLGGLLYLTGGLQNPFALLLLVPVLVSATALSLRHTIALGILTMVAATLLWPFHHPLPWTPGVMDHLPALYIGAVWLAILLALVFSAVYAFRVANEARKLGNALSATELVLEREHHLSELDGLAAAAAPFWSASRSAAARSWRG